MLASSDPVQFFLCGWLGLWNRWLPGDGRSVSDSQAGFPFGAKTIWGKDLLGAYENGGFNVLQEVIDFAMERGFLAAIDDDFERGLDECAPHVADKIVECTAPRG